MLCLTVQVAEQQGKYLARTFTALAKDPNAKIEPFSYKHMGSMASIGEHGTLTQTQQGRGLVGGGGGGVEGERSGGTGEDGYRSNKQNSPLFSYSVPFVLMKA